MQAAAIVTFVYAVLLAVGGIMGSRSGSPVSLYMGVGSALLVALGGVLMLRDLRAGLYLTLIITVALAVFGGYFWLGQGKPFMPRGLIFVLSVVELLPLLLALRPKA